MSKSDKRAGETGTPVLPIIAGLAAFCVIGMLALILATPDSVVASVRGAPTYSVKLTAVYRSSDPVFVTAIAEAKRGDWLASRKSYEEAIRRLENRHLNNRALQSVIDGQMTMNDWLTGRHAALRRELALQIPNLVDRVMTKQMTVGDARSRCEAFPEEPFHGLLDELNRQLEARSAQRVAESRRMLRVVLETPAHLREPVRRALMEHWRQFGYFEISFDEASGVSERNATAKTLTVRAHTDYHTITADSPDGETSGIVSIPRRLSVGFSMSSRSIVKTSWDKLETIVLTAEIPPVLGRLADGEERWIQANKQMELNQEAIAIGLAEKLAELPEFRLFPGVDLTAPIQDDAGNANVERAMAMALLEPLRFQTVFSGAIEQADRPLVTTCTKVTLELRSDEFDDLLPAAFKLLVEDEQKPVLVALIQRGEFIDYKLVLTFARNTNRDTGMMAYRHLMANFSRPEVYREVLTDIMANENTYTSELAYHWLTQLPPDMLSESLALLDLKNPESRDNLIARLTGREEWRTLDLALVKHYDRLRPAQRAAILARYTYDPVGHGAPGLRLLLDNLKNPDETPEVHAALLAALVRNSRQPQCWEALRQEVVTDLPLADQYAIRTALIRSAIVAVPGQASNFLYAQLANLQETLATAGEGDGGTSITNMRDLCIQKIIIDLTDKSTNIRRISEFAQQRADDQSLLAVVVGSMETACFEAKWDWRAEGVEQIIEQAIASEDHRLRRSAYKLCALAATADPQGTFRERLRRAAETETNPALVDYLQRELNREP